MYLSYDEYADIGGTADKNSFVRMEVKARRIIDRATRNRLTAETPVRSCVKYCMYELIGAIASEDDLGGIAAGREIASMSNDGVSVSFVSGSGGAASAQARYTGIVRAWLEGESTASGIHLLYAGVDA